MQRKPRVPRAPRVARVDNNAVRTEDVVVQIQYSQAYLLNKPKAETEGRVVMRPGRPVSKVSFFGQYYPFLYTAPICVTACNSEDAIAKVSVSKVVWVFRHILRSGDTVLFDRVYERSSTVNQLDGGMDQMTTSNAFEIVRPINMQDVSFEVQLVDVRSAQTGASVLRDADELSVHMNASYELAEDPGPGPLPCDCE